MNNKFIRLCCHFIKYIKYTSSANSLLTAVAWGLIMAIPLCNPPCLNPEELEAELYQKPFSSISSSNYSQLWNKLAAYFCCMPFWTPTSQCPSLPAIAAPFLKSHVSQPHIAEGILFFSFLLSLLSHAQSQKCLPLGTRQWATEKQKESNKQLQVSSLWNTLAEGANVWCINELTWFNLFIHFWWE